MKGAFLFLNILVIFSCSSPAEKLTSGPEIDFTCLKQDDSTLYVKISNFSAKDIYIPSRYLGNYTLNDDTVFLECFSNPKYNISYFFRYDKILPYPFYTSKKINRAKPDSTIKTVNQLYFNQFRIEPFIILKKDSSFLAQINFNIPQTCQVARIVYYETPFSETPYYKNDSYLIEDFISFENEYAKYVSQPVYMIYVDSLSR